MNVRAHSNVYIIVPYEVMIIAMIGWQLSPSSVGSKRFVCLAAASCALASPSRLYSLILPSILHQIMFPCDRVLLPCGSSSIDAIFLWMYMCISLFIVFFTQNYRSALPSLLERRTVSKK